MFAPQFYTQPQLMVSGFVQPLQIYQTPDQGKKRELSPLAIINSDQDGKRVRIVSGDIVPEGSVATSQSVRDFTLMDIMTELRNVAKKEDIQEIKDSLVAQSREIEQLRSEVDKHHDRIKTLEEQASAAAAVSVNRTRPDVYNTSSRQHGGAHTRFDEDERSKRRNVIIHGLDNVKEEKLMETVLDICQALKVIVFASDVEEITRLGRPDAVPIKPTPVRVTFQQIYIRDKIMRKKVDLANFPRFATTYINPDEPPEVRRTKGTFRRIATIARADGQEVTYRADWIRIGEVTYSASNLKDIPAKYQPSKVPRGEYESKKSEIAEAMDTASALPIQPLNPELSNYGPDVQIKLTKVGLTFSGPTAFCSNMYPCDFEYLGQRYTSSEQGIQHLNAKHHSAFDIAEKILGTTCAKAIKSISHDIPKSESWAKIAPSKLWDLNDAKYSQNPPLLKELIETAPHKLIEATLDSHWGGGGPLWSWRVRTGYCSR